MRFEVLNERDGAGFDQKFREVFGAEPPVPENRCIILALDDTQKDRVAGFLCGQTVVHLEPLWIDPEYRARFMLMGLIKLFSESQPQLQAAYITTDDENVSGILKQMAENLPKRGLSAERMLRELWMVKRG